MAGQTLILICQSGGKFVPKRDGTLSYNGGEAHAVDVNSESRLDDIKLELANMCNIDINSISVKYFLPGNRKTLITLSNDKDLQRMIDFHGDSASADVFVVEKEKPKTPTNRPNQITQVVAEAPPETAADVINSVLADLETAVPMDSVSTPVTSPAGTMTRPSDVATPVSNPVSPCTAGLVDIPITTNDAIDVRKKRGIASWRLGANGFTIVSVADEVGQQAQTRITRSKSTASKRRKSASSDEDPGQDISNSSSDYDPGQEIPSSDEDTDGFMESGGVDYNPSDSVSNDVGTGQHNVMYSWKNGIRKIGQEFKDVIEFRDVLRKYAIANHFMYRLKKNETHRVSAKCRGIGCPWRIYASWVPAAKAFRVKRFHKYHASGDTCKAAIQSQSTKHWSSTIVKEKMRDSPNSKAKELVNDICRDFGIELKYSQVWRGMNMDRGKVQQSYKDSYNQLPWFCEKAIEANPGSVVTLTKNDDLSLERLFVSFYASLHGFENGCRPIIFLDSISLKSNYLETLLIANAVDGNDSTFPLAFAIVDIEDEDSWVWFFQQLKSVVSSSRTITFVSDKNKGLGEKVLEVFENAHYGYSMYYLIENFKQSIKGPFHGNNGKGSLKVNFVAAAHAIRLDEFTVRMEKIKSVSSAAYDWIMNSEPQFWASHLFKGEQFNHITINVAREFEDWIIEARKLPILEKIDMIRCKMVELINTRRIDPSKCTSILAPQKEEKLQDESIRARGHRVLRSSEILFEVHDNFTYVVNMDLQECTCQWWKFSGIPCSHAIAVFNITGKNCYDYCSRYFTIEALQLMYSESINPLPEIEKITNSETADENHEILVQPPRTRTPEQLKRKKAEFPKLVKKRRRCSRCNEEGHSKTSCNSIIES